MLLDSRIHELLSRWEESDGALTPEQLCADCPELIDELRRRMAQLGEARQLLDPAKPASPQQPQIPGYEAGQILGEGGMGTVWRAVQLGTRRAVALKVMNGAGMVSPRARERFRREVELASRLDHSHIARVYDGDVRAGVCYYAMELIDGVPLDEFAASRALSRPQILDLFRSISLAVHYAHQRGIIHRDLKPSNILVDAADQPHVLDFGLAKDLHGEAHGTVSLGGAVPGTPAYMSPEQAAGRPDQVDTRSDVYSLGVILYRLIVGRTPHEWSGSSIELLRRISEQEATAPRQIDSSIDRDLEAIMLRALEHDPARRYGSADEFAQDIKDYLDRRPVRARRRTRLYVISKWLRRNRYRAATAAAVMCLLLAMAVASYINVARQRDLARSSAQTSEAVLEFFTSHVLNPSDPAEAQGREPTARELLDRAAGEIGRAFQDRPVVEARLLRAIGRIYVNLSLGKQAEPMLRRAFELNQKELGADDPQTLRSAADLAFCLDGEHRMDEALSLLRDTLARQRRVLGEGHPDTLMTQQQLANVMIEIDDLVEAEKLLRQTWSQRRAVLGEDHPDTIWSMSDLGAVLSKQDRLKEGEPLQCEALRLRLIKQGERHIDTLNASLNLSTTLARLGKFEESEALLRENIRLRLEVYKANHPSRTLPIHGLGMLRAMKGHWAEAEALFRESYEIRKRADPHQTGTLQSCLALCQSLMKQDRGREAQPHLNEMQQLAEEFLQPGRAPRVIWINLYAAGLVDLGQLESARTLLLQCVEMAKQHYGAEDPRTRMIMRSIEALPPREPAPARVDPPPAAERGAAATRPQAEQ